MNAKQRRVFRRGLDRFMDAFLTDAYGGTPAAVPLCRVLRESPGFWRTLDGCEDAARGDQEEDRNDYDDYSDADYWDDEDEQDEDGDTLGCWEGGKFRAGLCPDDLCHGANRCMAKARPWE